MTNVLYIVHLYLSQQWMNVTNIRLDFMSLHLMFDLYAERWVRINLLSWSFQVLLIGIFISQHYIA